MSLLAEFEAAQLPSEGRAHRRASRGSAEHFSLAACVLPCRATGVAASSGGVYKQTKQVTITMSSPRLNFVT